MKVLVATEKPFAAVAVEGIRKEIEGAGHELVLLEKYTDASQLLDAVKDADAMIVRSDKVTPAVLDAAQNLKIVVRAGAGYDSIDTAYAKEKGITHRGIILTNYPENPQNPDIKLLPRIIEEYTDVKILGILPKFNKAELNPSDLISEILSGVDLEAVVNIRIAKLQL